LNRILIHISSTLLSVDWALTILSCLLMETCLARIIECHFICFVDTAFLMSNLENTGSCPNTPLLFFILGYLIMLIEVSQLSISFSMFNQFNTSLQYCSSLFILVFLFLMLMKICAFAHFKRLYLFFDESLLDCLKAGKRYIFCSIHWKLSSFWLTFDGLLLILWRHWFPMIIDRIAEKRGVSIQEIALIDCLLLANSLLMEVFGRAKYLCLNGRLVFLNFLFGFWVSQQICFVDNRSMPEILLL